jgi:type II secretory pathway pseudopilin PulG
MPTQAGAKTTRKHVLNKQGFSLVEICIAMGIAAVLILSLAQYSLNAARSQKSQDLSNEFSQVMGTVGQALANESVCTSIMSNIPPAAVMYPNTVQVASLFIPPTSPAGSAQTILAQGPLPSGLNITTIYIGTPYPMGPVSGGLTPEIVPITVSAMKGPAPSASPSGGPGLNTYFIGNSLFTKTFTVAAWVNLLNGSISKCVSSQDMAQGAPAPPPVPYPSPTVSCLGNPPTCPSGSGTTQATCCMPTTTPVPYWACQSYGWTCS